jgi:hypothetical protein
MSLPVEIEDVRMCDTLSTIFNDLGYATCETVETISREAEVVVRIADALEDCLDQLRGSTAFWLTN